MEIIASAVGARKGIQWHPNWYVENLEYTNKATKTNKWVSYKIIIKKINYFYVLAMNNWKFKQNKLTKNHLW